ncbi:hypothetical protein WAI453_001969 [Rhynchosporium graminicola]
MCRPKLRIGTGVGERNPSGEFCVIVEVEDCAAAGFIGANSQRRDRGLSNIVQLSSQGIPETWTSCTVVGVSIMIPGELPCVPLRAISFSWNLASNVHGVGSRCLLLKVS